MQVVRIRIHVIQRKSTHDWWIARNFLATPEGHRLSIRHIELPTNKFGSTLPDLRLQVQAAFFRRAYDPVQNIFIGGSRYQNKLLQVIHFLAGVCKSTCGVREGMQLI
jgi:hypothetical protein